MYIRFLWYGSGTNACFSNVLVLNLWNDTSVFDLFFLHQKSELNQACGLYYIYITIGIVVAMQRTRVLGC